MKQELQAWLCDVTADVEALDSTPGDITPDTDDHAEQLRMRRYNVKVPACRYCFLFFTKLIAFSILIVITGVIVNLSSSLTLLSSSCGPWLGL